MSMYVLAFLKKKITYNPTENPFIVTISKWYWYTDDIFCVAEGGMNELQEFTRFLNEKDLNLDRIHFLDMWVEKKSGTLCTTQIQIETPYCLPIAVT